MLRYRTWATALAATCLYAVANAQATGANGVVVVPRYFNDFPNSTFASTVNWPTRTVTMSDTGVSGATGFANRHLWWTSNNGGSTAYGLSGPNDFFNFTMSVDLTASPGSRKEAGFYLQTGGTTVIDGQFMLASDNGEVAIFGGAFPFYSFTANGAPTYTLGTTVNIGLKYFKDTDNIYKFQYSYAGFTSPAQQVGDVFASTGLSAGTHIGAYLQVTNVPTNSSNFGAAVYSNINVAPVPEPASLTAIGLGLVALIRRRRNRRA